MSKFFFDCFDGERHLVDDYGIDLEKKADVSDHAAVLAQSLLTDGIGATEVRSVSVTVRASHGPPIYVAHCSFTGCWTMDEAPQVSQSNDG